MTKTLGSSISSLEMCWTALVITEGRPRRDVLGGV